MDYSRMNYVAQPGDGVTRLIPGIGVYDHFSINWGYRHIRGAATPDAERSFLDSLARQQDTNPWLRFGNMDGIDPRTQREAVGDDPVRASTFGVANLRRLMPMLITATTTDRLDDYDLLNDMYGRLIGQWALEMSHVSVVVGGVYRHEKYPNQPGVIHTAVPRATQQGAVRFLLDNVFTTPSFLLDPEVLRLIEPTGSVERIRVRQLAVLADLLLDSKLSRLVEQQAFATAQSPAYTIADLFGDLHRGIFSEAVAARPNVDAYRRNVQRSWVDQMDRLINTPLQTQLPPGLAFPGFVPPPPRPADARALARADLVDLDGQLRTAILRTTDRVSRAHFQDLRARIDRILNPPR
jgi:hypothetical protein